MGGDEDGGDGAGPSVPCNGSDSLFWAALGMFKGTRRVLGGWRRRGGWEREMEENVLKDKRIVMMF